MTEPNNLAGCRGFIPGAGLGAACYGVAGLNSLSLPAALALVAVILRRAGLRGATG